MTSLLASLLFSVALQLGESHDEPLPQHLTHNSLKPFNTSSIPLNNDQEIATLLNAQGFKTTQRQVKTIRLSRGWRHRNRGEADKATTLDTTFARVEEALSEGTVREYGREFLQSNLRDVHGFRGTENNTRGRLEQTEKYFSKYTFAWMPRITKSFTRCKRNFNSFFLQEHLFLDIKTSESWF
jgi:hypothetical protein